MIKQTSYPIYSARCFREIPWHWSVILLLLKEPCDSVHLRSECCNHPRVLVHHSTNGKNSSQLFKSSKILESMRSIPDTIIGCLQFGPQSFCQCVHSIEEILVVFIKMLISKIQVIIIFEGKNPYCCFKGFIVFFNRFLWEQSLHSVLE